MVTGGFVTLFNPGLETKVSEAIGLPVATAVSSAVAALNAFGTKSALLHDTIRRRIGQCHQNTSQQPRVHCLPRTGV